MSYFIVNSFTETFCKLERKSPLSLVNNLCLSKEVVSDHSTKFFDISLSSHSIFTLPNHNVQNGIFCCIFFGVQFNFIKISQKYAYFSQIVDTAIDFIEYAKHIFKKCQLERKLKPYVDQL